MAGSIPLMVGSIRFLPNAVRAWFQSDYSHFLLLEIPIAISSSTTLSLPVYTEYPYGIFLADVWFCWLSPW